ncbi:MAG: HAD-IIA family hydrolase [Planctomycetota bacterium]
MSSQDGGNALPKPRGYLIDLDGTLYVGDKLIDGASDFIHRLRDRGIPHAFVTNITSRPRAQVLERIRQRGLEIDPNHVLTAPLATRDYLDRQQISACYYLTCPSLMEDFGGHPHVEDHAEAVVVGDMGRLITFQSLNTAFRLLLDGAHFVTMSRSKCFREPDGISLDAGSFVAMLEHASGRSAVTTGKPSAEFFRSGLKRLGLSASEVAMVGDDLESDVGGAQRAGMSGILVLSGKTPRMPDNTKIRPDAVVDSIADCVID